MHATNAEERRVHARARGTLIEHHELFALFETPERRRQRTDVHRLRGDVEKMRQNAADFAVQHADQLSTARHGNAEQLFRRKAEGMLLIHRRDVIEPVEVRNRLQIGLLFDQLFSTAMKQTNVRIDALDHLAVKLQHEAQHAVRRRMLRSEVDSEIAHARRFGAKCFGHQPPAFGASAFSSPGSG